MDKSTTQQLCFVLGLLLFGALFMVSVTTWYVHEYRGERFFATGRLESVAFDIAGTGNYVLELGVNGERYEIMRPRNEFKVLPYDFGVQGEKAIDAMHALETRLRGDIGRTANIEYIQFEDRVLGLTIDGVEYLNADEVAGDHIAYQSLGRNIFAAVFAALLIPFVLLLRRLSRMRRADKAGGSSLEASQGTLPSDSDGGSYG